MPEALARADFTNLSVLLRHARDGCWAFALYNFATVREQVVAALKLLLDPLPVYEWTYAEHDPYPLSYIDRLSETQRQERAIVFIFDFEKADDKDWKALDYNRELIASHPHGLVFWVTPTGRGRAARQAPHFWAQRSGVFDFSLATAPDHEQMRPFVNPEVRVKDRADLQRQLRLYLGMLADLTERSDIPPLFVAELHHKAARAAYYLDEIALARTHAQAAHDLAVDHEDRQLLADILRTLGDLALREDDLPQARQRYEAALRLYPALGARLGEANVLQSLGNMALAEGDVQSAFEQYRAAYQAHEAAGDRLGMAADLGYLGRAAGMTGAFKQAILLYEECITIYRHIQEWFSQAVVLHWQGNAFWELGSREAALAAWWQAREIAQRIGLGLAQQLEALFAQVAQAMGDEAYARLEAALSQEAEAQRQRGVAAAQQEAPLAGPG